MHHHNRKFRVIQGVCYPDLKRDHEITTHIDASSLGAADQSFYYDPSIMLSDKDVKDFVGKPICVEHDESMEAGIITEAWVDSDKKMRILARVYTDHKAGEMIDDAMTRKALIGLSVGYGVDADKYGRVMSKPKREVSLCGTPFFNGAQVSVTASNNSGYKKKNEFCFKISAMSGENIVNKDAVELARLADTQKQEADELKRQLEAQSKKIAEYEAFVKQQAERDERQVKEYGEQMAPKLKEVLEYNQKLHEEANGPGAMLHTDFVQAVTAAFSHPDSAKNAEHLLTQVRASKKRDAEIAKKEAEMEELKKFSASEVARITASKKETSPVPADMNTDSQRIQLSVGASRIPSNRLFCPAPGKMELQLLGQTAEQHQLSVTASAGTQTPVDAIPEHKFTEKLAGSARHHAPAMFSKWVHANYQDCPTFITSPPTITIMNDAEKKFY